MALVAVTNASKRAYTSRQGTAQNPDQVALRLADKSGTVRIEQGAAASNTTSFFIEDTETFAATLVAGDYISVICASTENLVVTGPQTGLFGS